MNRSPATHQVIRASAGSGKTFRLTGRYLRLLLAGADAGTILATTFTRKAAGEILDRVLQRLATAAGDANAAHQLAEQLEAKNIGRQDLVALLRRLLGQLHRVRIGTLDSFYIALAGSFSFELDLPANWSICEEADDVALRNDALERLLEQQPEDIGRLIPLLSKGELTRSVERELHHVIADHDEIFRGSDRAAWEALAVPEPVVAAERAASLEQLRDFDFSACGHKGFVTARDKDLANFEREDWKAFLASGLAGKRTYYRKPVPPACQAVYQTLLRHSQAELLGQIANQTKATWDLLDRFHRELRALKQASGQLRFTDVTQALADGFSRQAVRADALAFRLDGAIEHLLLDEFQDTSLAQWRVLRPIAQGITRPTPPSGRSFFCVGDVKQAIYGWRGGMADIFDTLATSLGRLEVQELEVSHRCAQPIIDAVNQVFENLDQFAPDDKHRTGLDAWRGRFLRHKTSRQDEPGYVCLHSGPAHQDEQSLADHRGQQCRFVSQKIREWFGLSPRRSIGILCRKNDTVARMIYELRQLGVEASEEGGNPLTDSAAVELMLSLCTLADHPGHSIARFHVKNCEQFPEFADVDAFAQSLRRELLANGYGAFVQQWATRLAPACDRRELSRLQQLVEMAFRYQARSTLRADDFVRWVRQQKVPDPSAANVRVMTIHAAKGLEFDIVILPELDSRLLGQGPSFVVGRDPATLGVNFVCRYADEKLQAFLAPAERSAFEQDYRQRVEESMSLLYVAMTRAIHGLYLFIPGPRTKSNRKDAWHNLLLQTLAPTEPWVESRPHYEHGDRDWIRKVGTAAIAVARPPDCPEPITFRLDATGRRRGLETAAPSQREGQARVATDRLFHPSEGTGMAAGTLYHAWFEAIAWLDDGVPTDEKLRDVARKVRQELPAATWNDLDRLLADFRTWLTNPDISAVLRRSVYANPRPPGFPKALASMWTNKLAPQMVERERRFLVRDGTRFWNGSFDRIVWLGESERIVAADVIDFKTDALRPGDEKSLKERTEHYRPQLEAYRRAVTLLAGLSLECVATRLVFTFAGRVVEV